MKNMKPFLTCFIALLLGLPLLLTADDTKPAGDPYPLTTDPVTGAALGDKPVNYIHDGRQLRFADEKSLEQFKNDPKSVLQKLDKQLIEQQLATYALTTCPKTGEKLGEMGEPVNYVYNNRLVRLCCKSCVKSVAKKPADFFAKLDAAVIEKQAATYPLKTCVVSGDPLPKDKPINHVIGSRLVQFCCEDCIADFNKDPAKYMAKIDAAAGK